MKITVTKLTDEILLRRACSFTTGKDSNMSLSTIYKNEHSPIRTQMFWIEMEDIPTFVSVHLVRHKIGVEHFVRSNREDRDGDSEANRNTPVNHAMLLNAQTLINMARKRLCRKASKETQDVMKRIRFFVSLIDSDLSDQMIPECEYRRGYCPERDTTNLCWNNTKEA